MTELNSTSVKNDKQNSYSYSYVDDTLTMLGISIAQIRTSLSDSNSDVDMLTRNFSTIADKILTIKDSTDSLSNGHVNMDAEVQLIGAAATEAHAKIGQAVIEFQFFDRMSQRLSHVIQSLDAISSLIKDPDRIQDPMAWMKLQSHLHDSYSMESERVMFQSIVNGASIDEAIAIYHEASNQEEVEADSDDVELF